MPKMKIVKFANRSSHTWINTICPLFFEFSIWYSLDKTYFQDFAKVCFCQHFGHLYNFGLSECKRVKKG